LDILNLPLTNRALYVRRVYGGVFVQNKPNTFYVDLFGPNFGGGEEGTAGVKLSFNVFLNGKPLPVSKFLPPYDAVFTVPAAEMEGLFDAAKIKELRLDVNVTRETSHWYNFFGLFPDVQAIHLPYYVSLLPKKVGTLTVSTQYPDFEWKALQPVVPQTKVLQGPATLGPFSAPTPVMKGIPDKGDTKIDPSSIVATCVPDMQNAYDFGKGRILSAKNPVFKTGFRSANNCGSKGDRDAAIDSINRQFQGLFNLPLKQNCQEDSYGMLSVQELLDGSKPTKTDVSGCADMAADPDIQWLPNGTGFSVLVKGTPIDPDARFFDPKTTTVTDAKWKVSYQLLTYVAKEKLAEDSPQVMSVSESEPIKFEVMNHIGQTSTTLTFEPRFGTKETNVVGLNVGNLQAQGPGTPLADRVMYRYQFQYPDLNLNVLRGADGLH
jgi:hypothetical protein